MTKAIFVWKQLHFVKYSKFHFQDTSSKCMHLMYLTGGSNSQPEFWIVKLDKSSGAASNSEFTTAHLYLHFQPEFSEIDKLHVSDFTFLHSTGETFHWIKTSCMLLFTLCFSTWTFFTCFNVFIYNSLPSNHHSTTHIHNYFYQE